MGTNKQIDEIDLASDSDDPEEEKQEVFCDSNDEDEEDADDISSLEDTEDDIGFEVASDSERNPTSNGGAHIASGSTAATAEIISHRRVALIDDSDDYDYDDDDDDDDENIGSSSACSSTKNAPLEGTKLGRPLLPDPVPSHTYCPPPEPEPKFPRLVQYTAKEGDVGGGTMDGFPTFAPSGLGTVPDNVWDSADSAKQDTALHAADGHAVAVSREAQEAQIRTLFDKGMAAFERGWNWTALDCFRRIFAHDALAKECVTDWSSFDWDAAREKHKAESGGAGKSTGDMARILFTVSLAMVGLAENPTPFYLQALAIRPEETALWLELGQQATRRKLWTVAEFAFRQCRDELSALEGLLLLYFIRRDYDECLPILKKVLAECEDHRVAHAILSEMRGEAPIWCQLTDQLIHHAPEGMDETRTNLTRKINAFRQRSVTNTEGDEEKHHWANPFLKQANNLAVPWYQPLVLRLPEIDAEDSMIVEKVGRLLCNAYDRIEEYSSFAQQEVIFEANESWGTSSCRVQSASPTKSDGTPIVHLSRFRDINADLQNRSTSDFVLDEGAAQSSSPSTANLVEGLNGVEDTHCCILTNGEAGSEKCWNKRKATTQENEGLLADNSNSPQKKARREGTIQCRRSTRFIEDVENANVSQSKPPAATVSKQASDAWDLHTIMEVERNAEFVPTLTKQLARPREHPEADRSKADMDNAREEVPQLLRQMSEVGINSIDRLLFEFLSWVSTPRELSSGDAEIIRQVYLRWADSCPWTPPYGREEANQNQLNHLHLAIHMAAAELGCLRAFSLLLDYHYSYYHHRMGVAGPTEVLNIVRVAELHATTLTAPKMVRVIQGPAESEGGTLSERALDDLLGLEDKQLETGSSFPASREFLLPGGELGGVTGPATSTPCPEFAEWKGGWQDGAGGMHSPLPPDFEIRFLCARARLSGFDSRTKGRELQQPQQSQFLARATELLVKNEEKQNCEEKIPAYGSGPSVVHISREFLTLQLADLDRRVRIQQMDTLKAQGHFEELEEFLLNKYDWCSATEGEQVENMFLLMECSVGRHQYDSACEWWLRILQLIRDRTTMSQRAAKSVLRRCIDFIASAPAFLPSLAACVLKSAGGLVADLLYETSPFNKSISLWRACYQLAQLLESVLSEEVLNSYYAAAKELEERMPCRSLMVLAEAHRAIGKAEKCHRKGARFLRYYLDELYRVTSENSFFMRCLEDEEYSDILENVQEETFQIICCGFSDRQWKQRSDYPTHWSNAKWEADWTLATKIITLLMPRELPDLFDSNPDVDERFYQIIEAVFPFLLRIDEEDEQRFHRVIAQPTFWPMTLGTMEGGAGMLDPEEQFNAQRSKISGDPRGDLLTFADGIDEERQRELTLQSRVFYALTGWYYASSAGRAELQKEELHCITSCLAICAPFLDDNLQSAVWLVYGRALTRQFSCLGDASLPDKLAQWLFPFQMALLLKGDSVDAHMDIATLLYQIRARLARFAKRKKVDASMVTRFHLLTKTMLHQCRMHCRLALLHSSRQESDDEERSDYGWLANYFLGKIAEKLEDPASQVLGYYYQSAVELERTGYKYPPRINKEKQENFEPVEIHYRVHSYAIKVTRRLLNSIGTTGPDSGTAASEEAALKSELKMIEAHLERFTYHGVSKTVNGASAQEFHSGLRLDEDGSPPGCDAEQGTPGHPCRTAAELGQQIDAMCVKAFALLITKFPHYKAIYRIAEKSYEEGDYQKCWKTLCDSFYGGSRKRTNGLANLTAENIIEISRSDFERGGSLVYHAAKILKLSIDTNYKSNNLERLGQLLGGLLPLRNDQDDPAQLSNYELKWLREHCVEKILQLLDTSSDTSEPGNLPSSFCSLLEGLLKRLRREGYAEIAEKLQPYSKMLPEAAPKPNTSVDSGGATSGDDTHPRVSITIDIPTTSGLCESRQSTECTAQNSQTQFQAREPSLPLTVHNMFALLKNAPPDLQIAFIQQLNERGPPELRRLMSLPKNVSPLTSQSHQQATASTTSVAKGDRDSTAKTLQCAGNRARGNTLPGGVEANANAVGPSAANLVVVGADERERRMGMSQVASSHSMMAAALSPIRACIESEHPLISHASDSPMLAATPAPATTTFTTPSKLLSPPMGGVKLPTTLMSAGSSASPSPEVRTIQQLVTPLQRDQNERQYPAVMTMGRTIPVESQPNTSPFAAKRVSFIGLDDQGTTPPKKKIHLEADSPLSLLSQPNVASSHYVSTGHERVALSTSSPSINPAGTSSIPTTYQTLLKKHGATQLPSHTILQPGEPYICKPKDGQQRMRQSPSIHPDLPMPDRAQPIPHFPLSSQPTRQPYQLNSNDIFRPAPSIKSLPPSSTVFKKKIEKSGQVQTSKAAPQQAIQQTPPLFPQ